MQQEAGLKEVEFLSREEVEERFPYVQTVGLTGATWCPSDGFLLPNIVYNDGALAAKNLDAAIISGAEVTGALYNQAKTRIVGVISNKGEFHADLVINATNAWASEVSRALGGTALPISATKRYLYFMAGLNGQNGEFMSADDFSNCPMVIGPNGAYGRPTPQQELMMGWLQHTLPVNPLTEDQDRIEMGFSAKDPYGYGAAVMAEVGRWLPEVGSGKIQELKHATCGFYAETPDHNFIIDFDPKITNLILPTAF
jgi:glycine/D-amino acid oxidase-like deaminating enzyme